MRLTANKITFERVYSAKRSAGFTLIEIVVSLFVVAMIFGGVIYGYNTTAARAEISAYSLAAESLAIQNVEQLRSAQWLPYDTPVVDQLGMTNTLSKTSTNFAVLDIPVAGLPVYATNYVYITTPCTNPIIRQFKVDCVWMMRNFSSKMRGPYTNTAVTLRAPDQYE